jgi:low affinity Fe/Cu permease
MATPTAIVKTSQAAMQAELDEELRQAEEDFARGDFIELTIEQLDRCIAAGVWPWPDGSSE